MIFFPQECNINQLKKISETNTVYQVALGRYHSVLIDSHQRKLYSCGMSKYSGRGNFTFEVTGYDDQFMEIKTNGMNT